MLDTTFPNQIPELSNTRLGHYLDAGEGEMSNTGPPCRKYECHACALSGIASPSVVQLMPVVVFVEWLPQNQEHLTECLFSP